MRKIPKYIASIALILHLFLSTAQTVFAVEIPSFPSCRSPEGSIIADYNSGTHGVPGDATTYTGKDTVYKLNDTQVLQCLCTDDGQGVQTWWWKYSSLTEEEELILLNDGWIRVPNGSLWGLDPAPYFAKNKSYQCGDRGGVNPEGTSGKILGATTGYAATGSTLKMFFTLATLGLVVVTLRKINNNRTSH